MSKIIIFLLFAFYFLFSTTSVSAAPPPVDLADQWGFGQIRSLAQGTDYLRPLLFSVAGMALVIYFLFGATKMIFSGGDKNNVAAAKSMITHAIIGVILLLLVFIIVRFIPEFLGLTGYGIAR